MSASGSTQKDYLSKSVDIAVRLGLLAVVFAASFAIFRPFLAILVWATVIAIALYPAFTVVAKWLGGRRKLAAALFVVVTLGVTLAPTIWLGDSLLDGTVRIVKSAKEGTLEVPPPTEKVRTWPVIGEKAWTIWDGAHRDLGGTIEKLQPQVRHLGNAMVGVVSSIAATIVQTLLALIIAVLLMLSAQRSEEGLRVVARRLGGATGENMIETSVGTVRSVVKGVILVAFIQGLAAAVGLKIASVPAAGLWAFLVMVLAMIQLPPILILLPIVAWVFANNDSTVIAVFFLIWSFLVSLADNVLKPLLLGRGTSVPLLVILVGAIGGMLSAGVLGLFLGPVVLATAWELTMMWLEEARGDVSTAE